MSSLIIQVNPNKPLNIYCCVNALLNVSLSDLNYSRKVQTIKQIAVINNYDPRLVDRSIVKIKLRCTDSWLIDGALSPQKNVALPFNNDDLSFDIK